ncbi:ParB/RepB/Spo0J family partition protein [Patescibacteria group bacterium]|nr:ParB/RepB/Spo0J family partition protein [Patescibacteria group bacterium]
MKTALGKGLQSLIPKKESRISGFFKDKKKPSDLGRVRKESIFNIEIDKIRPNPNQPRKDIGAEAIKELADSIKEHGILQPLLVSKIEKPSERGRQVEYEIIAGERRWRAAKLAGLPSVPVIIRDSSANQKLEIALVENIQRKNLNAIETAMAYRQLQEQFGLKHHEIARKVGKERTTVSNAMRILSLPQEVQDAIVAGKLSEGHARAMLLARPVARLPIFRRVLRENLSVRRAEDLARRVARPVAAGGIGPKNPLFKKIESELKEILNGRRVSITKRGDLGNIRIEFADQEELDRIVYLLSQS